MIVKKEIEDIWAKPLRLIAYPFSSFLIRYTNITPNQITVASFLFALISSYFFIKGGFNNFLWGALFSTIYVVFDCIDGDIARTKNIKTKLGKWLDAAIGFVSTELILFSVIVGLNSKIAFIGGLIAMISFPMHFSMIHFYKSEIAESKEEIVISKSEKINYLKYLYGDTFFFTALPVFCLLNKAVYLVLFLALFGTLFWVGSLAIQFLKIKRG